MPIRPDIFGYKALFQAANDPARQSEGVLSFILKILTEATQTKAGAAEATR